VRVGRVVAPASNTDKLYPFIYLKMKIKDAHLFLPYFQWKANSNKFLPKRRVDCLQFLGVLKPNEETN